MQRIIILISILITGYFIAAFANGGKPGKQSELQLTASLGGRGMFIDSIPVVYIATTLYNPTSDTIKFISMSCSYEDLFTTNTNLFQVQSRWDCYRNVPSIVALPPKARTDRYIMIKATGKDKYINKGSFKINMYYLPYKTGMSFNEIVSALDNKQSATLVLSNTVDLERLNKVVY
jgi:hypothetical protein